MTFRTWPQWIHKAVAIWAVAYAAVQAFWLLTGTAVPFAFRFTLPPWGQVALALAALAALTRMLPVVTPVFVLATFGAPIEFVALLGGSGSGAVSLILLLMNIAGAGLLVAATVVRRRRGRCPRCGQGHPPPWDAPFLHPPAAPASPRTRAVVYVAMCGILPWAITKTIWTLGGDALGMTAAQWHALNAGASGATRGLAAVGIDFTVLAALLACFLILGLTHRWGMVFPLLRRRVPRLLPLIPAWLAGFTLFLYGMALVVGGLVTTGWFWMVEFGGLAFGGLGAGLLVGARSYARRTRPVCDVQGR